ncbi:hypothetical protein SS50377_25526 [Spironucleus salmonicida]|uniref:Uncharacterized protein n=1 Tax=Spironucleus salmonicida TaxID=348837 RepID=V6LW85_9EUKA|nr:hypothetical protein SS50377_25526 [Spironucleus salmonicida]|eukprot:EST45074.1 Hypothetical protein SS50377_15094 [Spironucleus salmonicida]
MYAVAGLVQIQGVKHQKYQLFENEQPVDLDLEEFAKYQKDLDIIRPRTTYWRQQQDYYQTNKMAFKNRLIDSQVEHVYITQFNFDDIVVQIIGVCMPNFSNSNQMNCEIVNFSSIGDKVEITLGCQRLCQIERLYQSVFRNSLSVDLNICQ